MAYLPPPFPLESTAAYDRESKTYFADTRWINHNPLKIFFLIGRAPTLSNQNKDEYKVHWNPWWILVKSEDLLIKILHYRCLTVAQRTAAMSGAEASWFGCKRSPARIWTWGFVIFLRLVTSSGMSISRLLLIIIPKDLVFPCSQIKITARHYISESISGVAMKKVPFVKVATNKCSIPSSV